MPDIAHLRTTLSARMRAAPYDAAAMGLLLVAAYLVLVNLDYAALWHDEAPAAFFGKTLLQQGSIVGWDGRNLVGGSNGRTLNEDLRDVLPPLMYVLNAAGFAVFGVNETGARIVHALVGIVALGVFWLLLRQHLPSHPRLRFLVFAFVALSPQLLLYFRQSRYFSAMVLTLVLIFWLYERYWRSRHPGYLLAVALVAVLAFFNHYAAGAATMLSLAAYHLLLRARQTTPREWTLFALAGVAVVAAGTAYLGWLDVLGGERSGFTGFSGRALTPYSGDDPAFVIFFERIWIYVRDLFTADWISWPVFLWFAGASLLVGQAHWKPTVRESRQVRRRGHHRPALSDRLLGDDFPLAATGQIVLFGALFALWSAMLSAQPIWLHPFADLRYYVGALPLLLAMKGLFTEWAWRKSKFAGAVAGAALLFTSIGAWPFNMTHRATGEPTLGPHIFQFTREVHRPYRDSIRAASDWLLAHAEQDDLVYVARFGNREALIFTTGHRVLFCCVLDEESPLPRAAIEQLNAPWLRLGEHRPDWIVGFGTLRNDYWEQVKVAYDIAVQLDVYPYPTQRPELYIHAFEPLAWKRGVYILRLKEQWRRNGT